MVDKHLENEMQAGVVQGEFMRDGMDLAYPNPQSVDDTTIM